jgi:hypothetical protein
MIGRIESRNLSVSLSFRPHLGTSLRNGRFSGPESSLPHGSWWVMFNFSIAGSCSFHGHGSAECRSKVIMSYLGKVEMSY